MSADATRGMPSAANAIVILIPGLWMPDFVLWPAQRRLERAGYAVRRFAYPSWRRGLDANVAALARCLAALPAAPATPIHLVGHSLGGLLILQLLAHGAAASIGRVVLLGSPALGSHGAERLLDSRWGTLLAGRTLADWRAESQANSLADSLTNSRPALPRGIEIGVIAGTRGVGLGRLLGGLAQPNDGAVALAETRLPEAADFIALHVSHSGMLVSAACAGQVASFLESGRFIHAGVDA